MLREWLIVDTKQMRKVLLPTTRVFGKGLVHKTLNIDRGQEPPPHFNCNSEIVSSSSHGNFLKIEG
jgi:hypothetical protein